MLSFAKRSLFGLSFTILSFSVVGCGGPKDEVLVQTPESQAQLEAYNEQMDKPSEGI